MPCLVMYQSKLLAGANSGYCISDFYFNGSVHVQYLFVHKIVSERHACKPPLCQVALLFYVLQEASSLCVYNLTTLCSIVGLDSRKYYVHNARLWEIWIVYG